MGVLSITFRGPFLVVIPQPKGGVSGGTVDVYAPRCVQHLGSVFYGDGSLPLHGRHRAGDAQQYVLSGPAANSGKISFQWNTRLSEASPILSPESHAPGTAYTLNAADAYFRITVPRPKIFYATNLVRDTEVVLEGTPRQSFPYWFTSFRLYYDWDLTTPVQLNPPVNAGSTAYFVTPPVGKPPAGSPAGWLPLADAGDIEVHFQGPELNDPDHQDASDCFNAIAQLAGLPWWLNFKHAAAGGAQDRTGSDCLAIPIVAGLNN